MAQSMINPDLIQDGDQVTLARQGGEPSQWIVRQRLGTRLQVESATGDIRNVQIAGRRVTHQILAHQPRLV